MVYWYNVDYLIILLLEIGVINIYFEIMFVVKYREKVVVMGRFYNVNI